MKIRNTKGSLSPTVLFSSVVETMEVAPTEVDKDRYQNMDEQQEAKHHHDLDEVAVPTFPSDECQDPKQHRSLDKVGTPNIPADECQELKQHDSSEDLEVPRFPLDDQISLDGYNTRFTRALKALVNENISLVEYGAQVQLRCRGMGSARWAVVASFTDFSRAQLSPPIN
ncbi:unnamed protein product [Penicillium glandicola]